MESKPDSDYGEISELELITADVDRVQHFVEICREKSKDVAEKRTQLEALKNEHQKLCGQLKALQSKRNEALEKELKLQHQLKSVDSEMLTNFETILRSLHFHSWDVEQRNDGVQITLHFSEDFYVKFNSGDEFALVEISPPHPNFIAMQEFLSETQDISGLLFNLQKSSTVLIDSC